MNTAKTYCETLQKIVQEQPHNLVARNNLGAAFFALHQWPEAIEQFHIVLQQNPDYIDAWYNLGLALMRQSRWKEATETWQQLLSRAPKHDAARFHLGCCDMAQENFTLAEKAFRQVIEQQPNHVESHYNLATCCLKQGGLKEAYAHYQIAAQLTPEDKNALFNLGVIAAQLNEIDQAIRYYQQAIQRDADFFAAHYNLALTFMARHHVELALRHLKQALHIQPDNKNIQYLIDMLNQHKNPKGAPAEYITTLFDAYADHYDEHLTQALDYVLPKLFLQAADLSKKISLDILDIGCGTGLCSAPFKPYAKTLTGVDLSEKMLNYAKQKNIFDTLIQNNIESFLETQSAAYDLILAGDVLVYIGELDTLFSRVHTALRKNGVFLFNTEIADEQDYQMNQSGRYGHSKSYLTSLAEKFHFTITQMKKITSRLQNNQPVYGYLCVFVSSLRATKFLT
ncbi:MAG: tetratricopeptide repeat protein [Gammaproteobacteria bacterium]|nr:tetratricopeptide repeat protein [Gammaproteobacteria bacterium]